MVRMRFVPKAEVQPIRYLNAPGARRQRLHEFDAYVRVLLDEPARVAVYDDLEEPARRFMLALRRAFKRAGVDNAVVVKVWGRNEVRAWLGDGGQPPAQSGAVLNALLETAVEETTAGVLSPELMVGASERAGSCAGILQARATSRARCCCCRYGEQFCLLRAPQPRLAWLHNARWPRPAKHGGAAA